MNSMASGLGPLVSVVLFALLGNKWEVRACSAQRSSAQLLVVWLSMKVFSAACSIRFLEQDIFRPDSFSQCCTETWPLLLALRGGVGVYARSRLAAMCCWRA